MARVFGAEDSQLPAHAAWARCWRNVRGYGECLEIFVAFSDGLSKCHTLSACSDRIRSVLDVGPADEPAELGEDHGADPEPAIRAIRRVLGGNTVSLERVELI